MNPEPIKVLSLQSDRTPTPRSLETEIQNGTGTESPGHQQRLIPISTDLIAAFHQNPSRRFGSRCRKAPVNSWHQIPDLQILFRLTAEAHHWMIHIKRHQQHLAGPIIGRRRKGFIDFDLFKVSKSNRNDLAERLEAWLRQKLARKLWTGHEHHATGFVFAKVLQQLDPAIVKLARIRIQQQDDIVLTKLFDVPRQTRDRRIAFLWTRFVHRLKPATQVNRLVTLQQFVNLLVIPVWQTGNQKHFHFLIDDFQLR